MRSNFYYALSLLPKQKRQAMRTIYEFCRHTDDLADEPGSHSEKQSRLNDWRTEIERCYDGTSSKLQDLHAVVWQYNIPKDYFLALVDGVEMDLRQTRYETFEELKQYCYAVASIVGLIALPIFGSRREETREYAVHLGYALQLTNILRDVKQDAENGRIYLPLEELRAFNYSERELIAGNDNEHFRAMMEFQTHRARSYYAMSQQFLRHDERPAMFAAETMSAIYLRLLNNIERANYDVFSKRIRVSDSFKLMTALRVWLRSKLQK